MLSMIKHRRFNLSGGFTVIEVLTIMSVIGILVSISYVGYTAYITNTLKSQISTTADAYQKSLKGYALEKNSFPKYPSCLPNGSKCCTSIAVAPTTVYCGNDAEAGWNTNSQAANVSKYINSNAPNMPKFREFIDCTTGLMTNGPCNATSSISTGIAYIYNTPGALYTSSDTSAKGFLVYYVGPTYNCEANNVMTFAAGNLSFNSSATYSRSTSTYRECILGLRTN